MFYVGKASKLYILGREVVKTVYSGLGRNLNLIF